MAPSDSKDVKQVATEQSSDAGFYLAAYGGAQFDTSYGDNRQTLSAGGDSVSTNSTIHSGWGAVGGLKAGYNFNSFAVGDCLGLRLQPAVEAEGMYIGLDHSHANNPFGIPESTTHFSSNSGDFFLNGILRFKNKSIVTPYIGIGAGLQYLTTHGQISTPFGVNFTGLNTSDLDFAAQGLAGFDVQITKHLSLFTEYKFIDAIGTDAKSDTTLFGVATTYRLKPSEIQQNLITAGVKYSF